MGKARLARIREEQGLNKTNLTHSSSEYQAYTNAQRYAVREMHKRTLVMRKIRKITRQIQKIRLKDEIKARRALFGYWFYWLKEGKIGPEDSNEPNLLHGQGSEKQMETLLKRWGIHG